MFLQYGIKSVSMDDISRELGISKKTLYQHISGKEELVHHVIEDIVSNERKAACSYFEEAGNAVEQMMMIAEHVTKFLQKISATTMYDLKKYYRRQWKFLTNSRDKMIHEHIKQNTIRGIEEGYYLEHLDPELISNIYLKLITYIVDDVIFDQPNKIPKVSLYEGFIQYHLRGICSPKGIKLLQSYTNTKTNKQ